MKLTKSHLYAAVLPARVAKAVGLLPSKWGKYKLRDGQYELLLEALGRGKRKKARKKRKAKANGLYRHQREGIAWLEERNGNGYLAHEMGLGKTRTVIEFLKGEEG